MRSIGHGYNNISSIRKPSNKRQVITQCFTSHSTWTTKIQRWFCHVGLRRLRNNLRRRLLGVLCVYASSQQQRTVPDSVWTTGSLVLETWHGEIHSRYHPHVKQRLSKSFSSFTSFLNIILYLVSIPTDWFNVITQRDCKSTDNTYLLFSYTWRHFCPVSVGNQFLICNNKYARCKRYRST